MKTGMFHVESILRLVLIALAIIIQFNVSEDGLADYFGVSNSLGFDLLMALCLVIYFIMLVIPFLPSIEVGLMIMLLFGEAGAVMAYLVTLQGLLTAYFIGGSLSREGSRMAGRIGTLIAPSFLERISRRHPSIALAVLLNTPGNVVLGGGGGIAMAYGYLAKMPALNFLVVVMFAVSPMPLVIGLGYRFA